jgi:hypothetical protein
MKTYLCIFSLLCLVSAFGQKTTPTPHDLLDQFKRIHYWQDYDSQGELFKYDSLAEANEKFGHMLVKYTSSDPSSIRSTLRELQDEGLGIATSEDGLFRIYSWDTWEGGTMHYFKNVFQYKTAGKVFSILSDTDEEGDPGYWYSEIYSIKAGGLVNYLAVQHAKYSTQDAYEGVKVFSINKNRLNDSTRLIKTRSGLRNSLGFGYNFLLWATKEPDSERLLEYNSLQKRITIPVVLESGEVTSRRIVYQFTGRYFERRK